MAETKKTIRILQVNKLYYPVTGGIERVVQQLAEGLCDVTDSKVLVCQQKGKTTTEQINGVEVTRASSIGMLSSLPLSMSFLWKFRKMSRDRDILHIHMPFPLGDLACFLSGYRGKVVLWWHSDIVRQKRMLKIYRPLMEWLLRRADCIIVATQGHIDGSEFLKPHEDKCRIIPFGVERQIEETADRWIAVQEESSGRQHSSKDSVRFLFVGRLVYYKGCNELIRAFIQASASRSDLFLDIVGTGPLEREMKEMVHEAGLEERVRFYANVEDEELAEFFGTCDVFVLPSVARSEAFGLVQIEAMAFGKPVINTKLPSGVPYVSLDQITGLTVPPKDVRELAQAMRYLAEHPEERREMGVRARQRMKTMYRIDTMLEHVKRLYEELMEGNESC